MSSETTESIAPRRPLQRAIYQPRRRRRYIYVRRTRADQRQLLLPFPQKPLALVIAHAQVIARPVVFHAHLRLVAKPRRCAPGAWFTRRADIGWAPHPYDPAILQRIDHLKNLLQVMKNKN